MVKILSWNVNGIRAALKKGFLQWFRRESPDILCLQETKAHPSQLSPELLRPEGYHAFWSCAERKGYSGVGVYSREKPLKVKRGIGIERFDAEGRMLEVEYEHFTLLNIYFPNGQRNGERLRYKLDFYDALLDYLTGMGKRGRKLVISGDYNTAHKPIDLARPKENEGVSGFLSVERKWLDKLESKGFFDTFRWFHADPDHYTWWDLRTAARQRNIGWRIDYHFVSENLKEHLKDAFIMPEVSGSDHCPVGILINFN